MYEKQNSLSIMWRPYAGDNVNESMSDVDIIEDESMGDVDIIEDESMTDI